MRHLAYAMRFTGQATPVNEAGTALKASTTSPSTTITSIVGGVALLAGDADAVDAERHHPGRDEEQEPARDHHRASL